MIDPQKVLLITPAYDGKAVCDYIGGLTSSAAAHLFGQFAFVAGCSDIRLARSLAADKFRHATQYDWLLFVDADIGFSARDLRILLDLPAGPHDAPIGRLPSGAAEPTKVDGHDALVVAEYARKQETDLTQLWAAIARLRSSEPSTENVQALIDAADAVNPPEPTRFGLGFARIHRSVFERIIALEDDDGAPRVGFFRERAGGADVPDLFPAGPGFNHLYHTEDHGFFFLARVAGLIPRVETRTRLHHVGVKSYPYPPPNFRTLVSQELESGLLKQKSAAALIDAANDIMSPAPTAP